MFTGSYLFQTIILGIHVSFRGCNLIKNYPTEQNTKSARDKKKVMFWLEVSNPQNHPWNWRVADPWMVTLPEINIAPEIFDAWNTN